MLQGIELKDARLVTRDLALVRRHCHSVPSLAAGTASLPGVESAFAQTMAAWRFYSNERVEYVELIEPLRESARRALAAAEPGQSHLNLRHFSKGVFRIKGG